MFSEHSMVIVPTYPPTTAPHMHTSSLWSNSRGPRPHSCGQPPPWTLPMHSLPLHWVLPLWRPPPAVARRPWADLMDLTRRRCWRPPVTLSWRTTRPVSSSCRKSRVSESACSSWRRRTPAWASSWTSSSGRYRTVWRSSRCTFAAASLGAAQRRTLPLATKSPSSDPAPNRQGTTGDRRVRYWGRAHTEKWGLPWCWLCRHYIRVKSDDRIGVSNQQQLDLLFSLTTKKTPELCITEPLWGGPADGWQIHLTKACKVVCTWCDIIIYSRQRWYCDNGQVPVLVSVPAIDFRKGMLYKLIYPCVKFC